MSTASTGRRAHVVDAGIGVKLLLPEPYSERARALFEDAERNGVARLYVPDLFYVECANVLWKHVRFRGHSPITAREGIDDILRLPLMRVPTTALVDDALPIAIAFEISAYDACYVALAEQLDVPLVTADERLVRKLVGSPFNVRWLGDPDFT